MPSKLRKVIAKIKDQTNIYFAKVSATNLKVAILKATTHKELPAEDNLVNQVLYLTFASHAHTSTCIHILARRMARTCNWVVALKSLNLIFRIIQEGDSIFNQEVLSATKQGTKLLDLSNFCDKSNSSPWDYTAFVRTFALYLEESLHCTLMGKLHRASRPSHNNQYYADHVQGELKPAVLLDKIAYWQLLLDRALATRPTGSAKSNRLVQLSLHPVVLESFDLYRNISNGITLMLDNFFHLPHQSCIEVFDACNKAAKQFNELEAFYCSCKGLGIGRKAEYPCVQMISDRLLETLRELLKDNDASCKINKPLRSGLEFPALPTLPFKRSSSSDEDYKCELNSEEIEQPSLLIEQYVPESALIDLKENAATMTPVYLDRKFTPDLMLLDSGDQLQQQHQLQSLQFCLFHQNDNSTQDLVPVVDPSQHQQPPLPSCSKERRKESWERVLTEYMERSILVDCSKSSAFDSLLLESSYNHNPFLQGDYDANVCPISVTTQTKIPHFDARS